MNKNRKTQGFTLGELLIVVAIIGVLVAISIPIFTGQLGKSRRAVDMSNARSAKAAAVAEYLTDGSFGEAIYFYDAASGTVVKDGTGIRGYGKQETVVEGAEGNPMVDGTSKIVAVRIDRSGRVSAFWDDGTARVNTSGSSGTGTGGSAAGQTGSGNNTSVILPGSGTGTGTGSGSTEAPSGDSQGSGTGTGTSQGSTGNTQGTETSEGSTGASSGNASQGTTGDQGTSGNTDASTQPSTPTDTGLSSESDAEHAARMEVINTLSNNSSHANNWSEIHGSNGVNLQCGAIIKDNGKTFLCIHQSAWFAYNNNNFEDCENVKNGADAEELNENISVLFINSVEDIPLGTPVLHGTIAVYNGAYYVLHVDETFNPYHRPLPDNADNWFRIQF